jgi:hypothetical protein
MTPFDRACFISHDSNTANRDRPLFPLPCSVVPIEPQWKRNLIVSITLTDQTNCTVVSSLDGAWDVLDRLGLALQQCDQAGEQIALTLDAVHECLSADVVFWHPGTSTDPFIRTGSVPLSADWARDFIAHVGLEATAAGDRLVRHFLDPGSKPIAPWPCSAALARISRSAGSWLGALSFHPRRLFRQDELPVLRLARRMLLNQRVVVETGRARKV